MLRIKKQNYIPLAFGLLILLISIVFFGQFFSHADSLNPTQVAESLIVDKEMTEWEYVPAEEFSFELKRDYKTRDELFIERQELRNAWARYKDKYNDVVHYEYYEDALNSARSYEESCEDYYVEFLLEHFPPGEEEINHIKNTLVEKEFFSFESK